MAFLYKTVIDTFFHFEKGYAEAAATGRKGAGENVIEGGLVFINPL